MNNQHPSIKRHAANVEAVRQWFGQFPHDQTHDLPRTRIDVLMDEFEEDSEADPTYDQFLEGVKLAKFMVYEMGSGHGIDIVAQAKRWVMRGFRDPNA
jgi:hypothetical protein